MVRLGNIEIRRTAKDIEFNGEDCPPFGGGVEILVDGHPVRYTSAILRLRHDDFVYLDLTLPALEKRDDIAS